MRSKCLHLFVLITIISIQTELLGDTMSKNKGIEIDSYNIVASIEKSELQKFASWFHQDWKIVFPDFICGAKMYFSNLPSDRTENLSQEIIKFLNNHKNDSSSEVRKAWISLGAQAWQADLDIIQTLNEFLNLLKNRNNKGYDKIILP